MAALGVALFVAGSGCIELPSLMEPSDPGQVEAPGIADSPYSPVMGPRLQPCSPSQWHDVVSTALAWLQDLRGKRFEIHVQGTTDGTSMDRLLFFDPVNQTMAVYDNLADTGLRYDDEQVHVIDPSGHRVYRDHRPGGAMQADYDSYLQALHGLPGALAWSNATESGATCTTWSPPFPGGLPRSALHNHAHDDTNTIDMTVLLDPARPVQWNLTGPGQDLRVDLHPWPFHPPLVSNGVLQPAYVHANTTYHSDSNWTTIIEDGTHWIPLSDVELHAFDENGTVVDRDSLHPGRFELAGGVIEYRDNDANHLLSPGDVLLVEELSWGLAFWDSQARGYAQTTLAPPASSSAPS